MNSFAAPSAEKPEYMRKQSKKGTKKILQIFYINYLDFSAQHFFFELYFYILSDSVANPQDHEKSPICFEFFP